MRLRNLDTERGALSIWAVGTALVGLLVLTYIVDSAAKIKAAEQADTYAAEAARAAVIAIGPRPVGGSVDAQAAAAATRAYLTEAGVAGTVRVTGPATVTVSVSVTEHGPMDGIAFTATRTATAQLLIGVDTGEAPG